MDADPAEKAKARRTQRLIYALMAVMIIAPAVAFYFLRMR